MAGERLPARFSLLASFGFGGHESASKPPQAICKPLWPSKITTRMTYLFSILLFFICGQIPATENNTDQINSIVVTQTSKNLITGWYYLTDKESGVERTLDGTKETFFINPNPIVTVDNFTKLKIYQSNQGSYGLTIQLDEKGTVNWSEATGKSIGQKLALIIDNKLYFTPTVNAQIDVGITALNRGDLTKKEMKSIKQKIEKEKN